MVGLHTKEPRGEGTSPGIHRSLRDAAPALPEEEHPQTHILLMILMKTLQSWSCTTSWRGSVQTCVLFTYKRR